MENNWTSYIIFIAVILMLLWVLFRTRKRSSTPRLQSAIGMISDINENLKILETRRLNPESPKKFKTGSWKAYQDSLDYFEPETLKALTETYKLIKEMNERIEIAKKTQSLSTLKDLPLDKLNEPMVKSKEGMVRWLRANIQAESQSRRNLFGF
jgi:hypothetical protein